MSDEQSTTEPAAGANSPEHAVGTGDTAVQTTGEVAYDPAAEDDQGWEEPVEDLPRRPRRRLLGVGGNPIALALLGVLLIACGFIGGVLVEKGQSTSSSSAGTAGTGLASRFAALRGGGIGGGGSGGGAGTTGATAGQVAYVSGSTLYVSTTEGNTVKVTTSPASTITKTVKAEVKGIHPGETVLVTGTAGKNGAISAESIRAGAGTAGGGGLGALFGGSGAGGGGRGGTGGSSTGGEPALFGKGG
ncbi:MAG TPA: hypothetical protein VGX26_06790 [Solirubrobacteraceae bacterium]|jgi:hypothetical protein|nr:hypothetical protein [Solirubrobacteraceae bacterium]